MTRMQWTRATRLPPTSEPAEAVWVDEATVTPFRKGDIRAVDRVWTWVTGAVHDADGVLVPQSQRLWQEDRPQPAAVDPARIRVPERVERRLEGSWVFAGHWTRHFGHFLLETLPNLWPEEAAATDGILTIRPAYSPAPAYGGKGVGPAEVSGAQQELLDIAGFGAREVLMARHRHLRVERLLVPERPVLLKHWVRPEAVDLWRRMSEQVGERGTAKRVFMSRSRFNAKTGGASDGALRTEPEWDRLLDRSFAAAGFEVVYPEELPVKEQIAIVRGADVLAGSSGSALHLSCFAAPGVKVLEVGDLRRAFPSGTQRTIDAACDHPVAFLKYGDAAALETLDRLVEQDVTEPPPTESSGTPRGPRPPDRRGSSGRSRRWAAVKALVRGR